MSITLLHLAMRPDWLARSHEELLEPALAVVDAHHHLYDRPGTRYMLDDYLRDIRDGGHNVVVTVFVQARAMLRVRGPESLKSLGETEFANGVAAMSASGLYGEQEACAAIIG